MFWRVLVVLWVGGVSAAHAHTLRCAPCTLPLFGASFQVTGTFADEPLAVAIVGHTKIWKVGALELRDVTLTAQSHGRQIDACAAGDVADFRIRACFVVPPSLDRLRRLRSADVTWSLVGASTTGHGTARLAWVGDDVRIEHGDAELSLSRTFGSVAIRRANIAAEIEGSLTRLALEVHGHLDVASITAGGLALRGFEAPLDLRIESGRIVPRAAVIAKVEAATLTIGARQITLASPSVMVHDGQPFAWSAFAGDEHRLMWTAIAGLPIDVGAGSLGISFGDDARVTSGHARFLGGELAVAPFSFRAGTVKLHVDGVSVARIASLMSGGHVAATGALDGEVVLDHDGSSFHVERASIHARAGGQLRVAPAIAELHYDRLTCEVQPAGHDPEAILSIHGRGMQAPQELDLAINIRGVRALAELL